MSNPELDRAQQLEDVLALVRTKVASAQAKTLELFVQRYFGQVDPEDLAAALREHGLDKIEDARLVVLEQDGSISVVPRESDSEALRRRRLRTRHV